MKVICGDTNICAIAVHNAGTRKRAQRSIVTNLKHQQSDYKETRVADKTPRVDEVAVPTLDFFFGGFATDEEDWVPGSKARQLEIELAAAQAENAALKKERDKPIWLFADLP